MRVIIVGAGISGLSTAAFLRRLNIDCVVMEQAPYLNANFQLPTTLYANALSCYKAFSIHGMFEDSRLQPEDYFGIKDEKGNWLLQVKNEEVSLSALSELDVIPHSSAPFATANSVVRSAERSHLSQELGKVALRATLSPRILKKSLREHCLDLRLNHRVVDLVPHEGIKGGVHVVLEDGTTEWCDVVIGADGMHSTVRKLLYPHEHIQSTSLNSMQIDGFCDCAELPPFLADGQPVDLWGKRKTISMFPMHHQGERRFCFSAHMYDPPHDVLNINDDSVDGELYREIYRNVLRDNFNEFGPEVVEFLKRADLAVPTEAIEVPIMSQWYNRRAVLVGEAAHGSLPSFLNHDASLCVEDAAMLAAALCDVPVFSDEGFAFVFRQYETVRRDRIEKYIRQSRKARKFCSTEYVGARNAVLKCCPGGAALAMQRWLSDWAFSASQLLIDPKVRLEIAYRT